MPCYHPLKAWKRAGESGISFNARQGYSDLPLTLPCRRCAGCRLEYSRQWAVRCMHEAQMWPENSFITLTYETPPEGMTLVKADLQKFWKRLRENYSTKKIRYFAAGEYGEECKTCGRNRKDCQCRQFIKALGRPHYHAIVFNHDWSDKKLHTIRNGNNIYESCSLASIWGKGLCSSADVTFKSCAYVARYSMKKITGEQAPDHYQNRIPEFVTMSRNKGIGETWLQKYGRDVYPHGFVVTQGHKSKPPRYYDEWNKEADEKSALKIKGQRAAIAKKNAPDSTPERLKVREYIQHARLNKMQRDL